MDAEAHRRRSERDAREIALLLDGYGDQESWVKKRARWYARKRLARYYRVLGDEVVELLLDKLHDRVVTFVRDGQLLPGAGSDADAREWALCRLEWACIDLTRKGGELWNWSNRRAQPTRGDEETPVDPAEGLPGGEDTEEAALDSLATNERRHAIRERCALALAWALNPDFPPVERAERIRIANGVIIYLRVSQEVDLPRETPGRFFESVTGTADPKEWDAASMVDARLVTSLHSEPITKNYAGVIRHRVWGKIQPLARRYEEDLT